ncbi:MAG: nucleoside monophosphate kinase, partial [Candidatus Vogelbacteria bacterium]|nr:nucleoside monophosphate kinase [Candidatus Vogelbacteria bacterium]
KSGSGKGTQAALLMDYLKQNDSRQIFNIETGKEFRNFINQTTYTARSAKDILDVGGRQPDFLAINIWGKILMDNLEDNEHIIGDGFPRSRLEAEVLDTAFKFYKRAKPIIIYMNVENESVIDRLVKRGRADDKEDAIKNRLKFYADDVLPAIEYYRNNPGYTFLDINGEPAIKMIHKDLISKLESEWASQ